MGIGGLLVLVIGYVLAFAPDKGHVEQSVVINAPAAAIFPHLNNMEKNVAWSPWKKMDPTAKNTFEGPAEGVGAKMKWVGESSGSGTQWITESVENVRVKSGLIFDGEEGEAWSEFTLSQTENGTKVTWTYDGESKSFLNKAKWIIGRYFVSSAYETGLSDLKSVVETGKM